jgi:hypothetical protein
MMRVAVTSVWLAGAVSILTVGCGDSGDGGKQPTENSDTTNEPAAGKGECNKGEYPSDHGTLYLCGEGVRCNFEEDNQVPLEKMRGYTSYASDLDIRPGDAANLNALSCLESVGALMFAEGFQLTDLTGLGRIKKASSLSVVDMPKLTSLAGLDSLTSTVEVIINFNDALTDIDGLAAGFTTQRLYVGSNANLSSLAGLADLEVTERISFENNKKLPDCAIEKFAARFPNAKTSYKGNLAGACP